MNLKKVKSQNLEELANTWGIDYQVFQIKSELIEMVKKTCDKHKISQRKLAAMVPGLSQDRVSKIFSGQVGHMSIEKLVEILSALNIKVAVRTRAA